MTEDLLRQRSAQGHQEDGPVDGVEADDVLADEVVALGGGIAPPRVEFLPVFPAPVLERGEVAHGRVEPDVEVLAGMAGNLEAEVRGVARNVPRQ